MGEGLFAQLKGEWLECSNKPGDQVPLFIIIDPAQRGIGVCILFIDFDP